MHPPARPGGRQRERQVPGPRGASCSAWRRSRRNLQPGSLWGGVPCIQAPRNASPCARPSGRQSCPDRSGSAPGRSQ
eukprot:11768112-Alexandrium_andersonii.AAC.1